MLYLLLAAMAFFVIGIIVILVWLEIWAFKRIREAMPDIWPFLGPVGLVWWLYAGMPDPSEDDKKIGGSREHEDKSPPSESADGL